MLRWRIALLVSAAIAISYLDRQTLPVAISAIARDIPLTNERFSALQSAFLLAYAFMYAGRRQAGGRSGHAHRVRRHHGVLVAGLRQPWLATSFAMLMASRFLLGMGEGGGFPAATRAVAEWFPVKERSTAMGIINAGTAVGAVSGAAADRPGPGLRRLALGFLRHRRPRIAVDAGGGSHPIFRRTNPLRAERAMQSLLRRIPRPDLRWIDLLRIRETWGLVTAKFLSDAAWYFYLFWLPKYLYDARGFDIKAVGTFAWIPYAAAGVGCLSAAGFPATWCGASSRWAWPERWRWDERGGHAVHPARAARAGGLGDRAIQPRLFRPAILVHPGDGPARRSFPCKVVGSVAGLVGFGGAMGGIAFGQWSDTAGPRLRLRRRILIGGNVSRRRFRYHSATVPVVAASEPGTQTEF